MDRNNRKDDRVPHGLSFLMWPALVRAPWLIGSLFENEHRAADRRRRRNR